MGCGGKGGGKRIRIEPGGASRHDHGMKPSDALATHRDELRQLLLRAGFARALVFGSVLAGTDTEGSDLDLLVDPTETTTLLTLAGVEADATDLLGVPVSVLTPGFLPPAVRDQVLRSALPL